MGKKKSREQHDGILVKRREAARDMLTDKTVKEMEEYKAARLKFEEVDKEQAALKDQPAWREFIEKKGIKPENLTIGSTAGEVEAEVDRKGAVLMDKAVAVLNSAEPIQGATWNNDGTLTITINPKIERKAIYHEISKLLDERGIKSERFYGQSLAASKEGEKIYNEVAAGKSLLRIAKERCRIDENPAYNDTVNRENQKVRRRVEKFMKKKNK